MAITISRATKETLCKVLKIKRLIEIMDRDYENLDEDHDIDRIRATRYADRNRGSIRINTGRFYTIREHKERIERAKRLKLP